jgi:hypothetical protein
VYVIASVFGPRRDKVSGEQGRFPNKELLDLYCLHSVFGIVKSRKLINVVYIGKHHRKQSLEDSEGKGG